MSTQTAREMAGINPRAGRRMHNSSLAVEKRKLRFAKMSHRWRCDRLDSFLGKSLKRLLIMKAGLEELRQTLHKIQLTKRSTESLAKLSVVV